VFGIGSGLYFCHLPMIKLNGLPITAFRPRSGFIFNRLCKALGVKIVRRRFIKPENAMQVLDANLEKGTPTSIVVGVYHLSYFPAPYRFHFNAHIIVCIGREGDDYLISDPIMEKIEKLSYEDLRRVRYAQGIHAPKGKMHYVKSVPEQVDLRKAVRKGIKRTVLEMVKLPGSIIGVEGMRFLARRIKKYPRKYDARNAARHLGQIVRMQEHVGTGGAGFRFLYAAFLQEAAELLDNPKLHDLSLKMTEVGDLWRDFAVKASRIMKQRNNIESYESIADLLMYIADQEEKIYRQLDKAIK
jgi:hypothetical protein